MNASSNLEFLGKLLMDDDLRQQSLGSVIRSLRQKDKISGAELARRLGITRQAMNDIEKNKIVISAKRAACLAVALGIPTKIFVELALQESLKKQGFSEVVVHVENATLPEMNSEKKYCVSNSNS